MAEICKLLLMLLAIPVGSASAERGFSVQNRVKVKCRNLLGDRYLKHLLYICINGPELAELFFDESVEIWINRKERRKLKD